MSDPVWFLAASTAEVDDAGGLLGFNATPQLTVCGTPTTCAAAGGLTWSGGAVTAH